MVYDWTKMNVVPRGGLAAWHQYEPAVSGHNIIYDYSGNSRTISCGAGNSPVLSGGVFNGQAGWYFSGTRDPLVYTGSLTVKHIFIIAAFQDASFATYRGLLSGATVGDLLVSNPSGDTFFNYSTDYTSEYRKADIVYGPATEKAPMSNVPMLIELRIPAGYTIDGIQIGQHKTDTTRKWKGYFFEQLIYTTEKTELERMMILQYAAMKYRLWPQVASGLFVFPFPANKARGMTRDEENYLSEPYSGDMKALVRGSFRRSFELPYALRIQPEFEAAEAFHEQHYPLTHFIHRDYRFYPSRDSECRITSPLREQGSDVTNRFNYSFEAIETN